jgi:hypothetical protein
MSNRFLTRSYQLLLHAYPKQTRKERGQVELDTLLGVSKPNQFLPRIAELAPSPEKVSMSAFGAQQGIRRSKF